MSDKEKSQKLYDLGAQAANLYLYDVAIEYLEQAAELDNAEAMYLLGFICESETGNEVEAFQWYINAAFNGFQKAFLKIALFYLKAYNIEHNKRANTRAEKWFKLSAEEWFQLSISRNQLAAEKGDPYAMLAVAEAYHWYNCQKTRRYGRLLYKNFSKNNRIDTFSAIYKRLANKGDADAMVEMIFASDWYERAFETFKKLANEGNVKAMFELSKLYHFGNGISANNQESIRWLNTAAKVEDVQIKIRAYRGIAEFSDDHQDAETFYKKAAELGDFISMIKLYDYYNTEKNFTEAKSWLKKSEEIQAEFLSSLQQEKF